MLARCRLPASRSGAVHTTEGVVAHLDTILWTLQARSPWSFSFDRFELQRLLDSGGHVDVAA
jgi:hypothetical protein